MLSPRRPNQPGRECWNTFWRRRKIKTIRLDLDFEAESITNRSQTFEPAICCQLHALPQTDCKKETAVPSVHPIFSHEAAQNIISASSGNAFQTILTATWSKIHEKMQIIRE